MQVRDYVIGVIKETYAKFGFTSIETPCVEHIENLTNKQGGENEKLIFKILKRGEKLAAALKCGSGQMGKEQDGAQTNDAPRDGAAFAADFDLADGGLRYDLTVPLVRYYSNHTNELPSPFKALQIGNVWRADRPQKGQNISHTRYRLFTECHSLTCPFYARKLLSDGSIILLSDAVLVNLSGNADESAPLILHFF